MIAEIVELNRKSSPIRSYIKDRIKAIAPWVTVDRLMADKRAEYDPVLKAILRRHGVCSPDIDARLDEACAEAIRKKGPSLATTVPAGNCTTMWAQTAWEQYRSAALVLGRALREENGR